MGGLFSSTKESTQKTETAPLSPLGEEFLNDLYAPMIAEQLDLAGYDVNFKDKEVYQNPAEASKYQNIISQNDKAIADLSARMESFRNRSGYQSDPEYQAMQNQMTTLENKNIDANQKLAAIPKEVIPDFDIQKREDPRVQQAIDNYGQDSVEVANIRDEIKQQEVFEAESTAKARATFFEKMVKFVNGDLSYTEEDRSQVLAITAPIKDAINTAANNIISQVDQSFGSVGSVLDSGYSKMASIIESNFDQLSNGFDQLSSKIKQSGYEIEDALKAASVQVRQGRDDLYSVLDEVISSDEAKTKFELDLLYQEADQRSAEQASLLGLPPGSMTEKEMSMQMKTDAFKSAMLELSYRKMQGKLGIATSTQDTLNKISLATAEQKIATIQELSGVDKAKLQSMADMLSKKEGFLATYLDQKTQLEQQKQQAVLSTIAQKETQLTGVTEKEQDLLVNKSYGNIPQMMGVAQSGMSQSNVTTSQNQAINATAMSPVANIFNQEQNRTLAEATTNTTQKSTPSFFDVLTDIGGVAMSGASLGQKANTNNIFKKYFEEIAS